MLRTLERVALGCLLVLSAPALACTGAVTIGGIATSVPNREIGGRCLDELIVDTVAEGAAWDGHGEFVAAVAKLAAGSRQRGEITPAESAELLRTAARSEVGNTLTVRVIGFNDFHGNLQLPGTFGVNTAIAAVNRAPVGGAEFVAGHVAKLKSANPLNVVVGAGDFIGASPLISALFNDEPSVEVLNRIGVDINAVGNHEFDKGSAELLRLQNGGCKADGTGCKGAMAGTPVPFEGANFQWLSANVISRATGETLLPPYVIKRFGRVKIAFIGMTLEGTPTIVTPTGVAGLEFRDEADTVNALAPELRRQGVEAIVVLVHEGGFQSAGVFNANNRQIANFSDINGCDGNLAGSAIAGIVSRLGNGVDAVVSGHTHAAYNCSANTVDVTVAQLDAAGNPVLAPNGNILTNVTPRPTGLANASGRLIPVTSASAFGRVLTTLDLVIDTRTRKVKEVRAHNSLVDRADPAVTPNAQIASIISGYAALVSPIANQVIGSITQSLPSAAVDKACNVPAGDLIADAQLAASAPADFGEAVLAFMNRGGVRNPGLVFNQSSGGEPDGEVTYGEAFTVQPFGNSLVTMTLTRQDIKNVLEQQFAGCRGQAANATRIMLPSNGFKYTWDGAQPCDARIREATLTIDGVTQTLVANGVVVDPLQTHRVTVNNFMATGGDGFTTFLNGTNLLGGAQDIDALVAHMQANFKAPNPPYAPGTSPDDLGSPRINRVGGSSCPTGANVNS